MLDPAPAPTNNGGNYICYREAGRWRNRNGNIAGAYERLNGGGKGLGSNIPVNPYDNVLWTKYGKLVDGEIETASITKENMYPLQADFGVCTYCGEEAEAQYDHIIPISDGDPAEISNQIPACVSCNQEKQGCDPIN